MQLFGVAPYLPAPNTLDALAQQSKTGLRKTEDPADTGAEGADHNLTIAGLDQQNLRDFGMREMKVAQNRHILGIAHERIRGQKGNVGRPGRKSLKKRSDVHGASGDAKLRMTAESAGKQLCLQAIGIDDKDTDGIRSGG